LDGKFDSWDWVGIVLAFAITLVLLLPLAVIGICPHHDGIMLKPALDVAAGQTLFKDTFTQYGALTTYLQAAALLVFGRKLLVLKVLTVFAYAGTASLLVATWRMLLPRALVAVAFVVWLLFLPLFNDDWRMPWCPGVTWVMLPWSSVYALLFQSAAYLLVLKSLTRPGGAGCAFASGASAALAFWCRQPVGAFLLVALVAAHAVGHLSDRKDRRHLRRGLYCVAGFGSVCALFFLHLLWAGSFNDWYRQNVEWPAVWVKQRGSGSARAVVESLLPARDQGIALLLVLLALIVPLRLATQFRNTRLSLGASLAFWCCAVSVVACCYLPLPLWGRFEPLRAGLAPVFLLMPALVLGGGWASAIPVGVALGTGIALPALLFRSRRAGGELLAVVFSNLICLASWLQYYPSTCGMHISWGVSPAIGPFLLFWHRLSGRRTYALAVLLVPLLLPALVAKARLYHEIVTTPHVRLRSPAVLAGMRVSPAHAAEAQAIDRALVHHYGPGKKAPMLLESPNGLYGALVSDLRNPGPFHVLWLFLPDPDRDRQRLQFIAREKPVILVETRRDAFLRTVIEQWHYRPLLRLPNGTELLVPPEAPAAPLQKVKSRQVNLSEGQGR
jgi:hypothetical protein